MSREIKFRAWNKETKCFFMWNLSFAFGGTGAIWGDVQQYTGLKDKNGKEIYEGDILERVTDVSVWKFKGVVEFQLTGAVGWRVKTNDGQWQLNSNDEYNIIGNIHENPELLL